MEEGLTSQIIKIFYHVKCGNLKQRSKAVPLVKPKICHIIRNMISYPELDSDIFKPSDIEESLTSQIIKIHHHGKGENLKQRLKAVQLIKPKSVLFLFPVS